MAILRVPHQTPRPTHLKQIAPYLRTTNSELWCNATPIQIMMPRWAFLLLSLKITVLYPR